MTIALTGTTGGVGSAVLDLVGGSPILIGRDASKLPSGYETREAAYGDQGMTDALAGVDTLFFVSGRESKTRGADQLAVVDSAVSAGVHRIVYLSILARGANSTFALASDHVATEDAIRATGIAYTFLRDSLYQDFLPYMAGPDGVIRGPAGTGRVSAVARQDVAEVAAAVLRDADGGATKHDGVTYELTGPEALSFVYIAERLSAASGRDITFHDETEAEAYESRAKFGAEPWQVKAWVTSYLAIAHGEMATVSDDIQRLIGRPATSFATLLAEHPETYASLLAD
jgi:uncharacterized protein YbjT (DUF2867 family)